MYGNIFTGSAIVMGGSHYAAYHISISAEVKEENLAMNKEVLK